MAVTKILARNGGLKQAIEYVLNGDKDTEAGAHGPSELRSRI